MSPRPGTGLTLQAVVETAVALADEHGIQSVSIRRVAASLDVRPMTLYSRISSKDDLLELMADRVVGLMLTDQHMQDGWRSQLTALARRAHAVLVDHPWMPAVLSRPTRSGPNAALRATQAARAVSQLRLASSDVQTLVGIVDDYVLGHALRAAALDVPRCPDAVNAPSYPAAVATLEKLPGDPACATRNSFETGLQTVLDGIEGRFLSAASVAAAARLEHSA